MKEISEEAAAGLAAGVLGTVIGFPLDVVKTRMQTSPQPPVNHSSGAGGVWHAVRTIVRREGSASLFKGMLPPLVSMSLLNSANFAAYSHFQQRFGATRSAWDAKNGLAAACFAPLASPVSTLEGLVKTQMQVDNALRPKRPLFRGSLDCARQLVAARHGGISILFHGYGATLHRDVAFLVVYFYFYEGFRHELIHLGTDDEHFNKIAIPVAGGMSGAMAWTASFPLDCVRAGVQGQDFGAGNGSRKNAFQVLRSILATKGFFGLYHGVAPSIARAFVVSGIRFSAYEAALYLLRGGREMHHD